MSTLPTTDGALHVPSEATLVIPNRVDLSAVKTIEQLLGEERPPAWLVESSHRPSAEIMSYLQSKRAPGIIYTLTPHSNENLLLLIRQKMSEGHHVVLLPGARKQAPAAATDVPEAMLSYVLHNYSHPVLPLYVGMFNEVKPPFIATSEPYDKMVVRVLPAMRTATPPALMSAWLNAEAEMVSQIIAERTDTLPRALLNSLLSHPKACVIDGIDDTKLSYRQLLIMAASLAKRLRKIVVNKRIGIVLPPGKYAIAANVACLMAGIAPVNIDYSYSKEELDRAMEQNELTRIITEHRFVQMRRSFPWPLQRDILFIDDAIDTRGNSISSTLWKMLARLLTVKRVSRWLKTEDVPPHAEALVTLTPAEDGPQIHGASLSHCAVLAGAALSAARFPMPEGSCVLSALPYHYRAGLMTGLIYPLLMGHSIVTYSLPDEGKRICSLTRLYKPAMAVFSPVQAREVLADAQEDDFASVAHLHLTGRLHPDTARELSERLHIRLCECYMPAECAMPVACSLPPAEGMAPARAQLPGGLTGTAGLPLPGLAIRITDIQQTHKVLPPSTPGLVWVKGAAVFSGYTEGDLSGHALPPHERWVCTNDVGQLRPDGLLAVGGPRSRYSKIDGELVSHEVAEQVMLNFFQVEEEPGEPKMAVVEMRDIEAGGECLVLLSTVHRVVGSNDAKSLRYALAGTHTPTNLSPTHIVSVRKIPTLPGGRINYPLCQRIAYHHLNQAGAKRSSPHMR